MQHESSLYTTVHSPLRYDDCHWISRDTLSYFVWSQHRWGFYDPVSRSLRRTFKYYFNGVKSYNSFYKHQDCPEVVIKQR
jgi:hypothetical protein